MKVINTTLGNSLSESVTVARTFNKKVSGLSGAEKPSALFFETRWGIHTFGMKFPIDCVVLDNAFRVRSLTKNLKPNRFFFWNPSYKNILELPAGVVSRTGTKIGDVLEFKP